MTIIEKIDAFGHQNILATHKTTFEITKEKSLTKRGDCVIGVSSNKAISDLSDKFKEKAKYNRKITCILKANDIEEVIFGYGHPALTFLHSTDIVIRKSTFKCSRTLMIGANKSASDLNKKLVTLLKNPETQLKVQLIIND